MKDQSFLFASSAIIAFFAAFSGAAESTADANRFLDRIGIARGSSQSLTNEWALPQSVLVSNTVFSVSGEKHFNHFSGTLSDTNETFVGTFEVDVSGSEAGSRTYWGLRQICRPLPPHLYYDFYDIDEIGGGLLLVWNTAVNEMGVTNRCLDRVSALYQNICTTVSSDTLAPDVLALALLRAGGVDVPDNPLRSSPAPEPFQAMRVFSSEPEDASPPSAPPAPEPFQAMLVFPSDLENETDSSASESRPESESEQEF